MDPSPITTADSPAPAARKVGVRTKANRNCCLVIVGIVLAPIVALGIYLLWPVKSIGLLPDTWQAGGPELTATWSVPYSERIRPEQHTVSPWILTQQGAYYCSTQTQPMSLERWSDAPHEPRLSPQDFHIYSGTATSDTLWLVGLAQGNVPQLRAFDPETLVQRSSIDLPQATIPVELLHGIDILATPDDHLLLLIEPRAKHKSNATNYGCWFDPATATFTTPVKMPGASELPDLGLYRAKDYPKSLLTLVDEGQTLRLRPRWKGKHDYLASLTTGEAVEDATLSLDYAALPRDAVSLPPGRVEEHGQVRFLREPSVRLELLRDLPEGHPMAKKEFDPLDPDTALLLGRGLLAMVKRNPELMTRIINEDAVFRGLSLADPNHDVVRKVVDTSLEEAIAHDRAIAQGSLVFFAGWSDHEILLLHEVLRPPLNVNTGEQILRIGILDVDTAHITWHGWIDWPDPFWSHTQLSDWRVAVYGDTLLVTCYAASMDAIDVWHPTDQELHPVAARIELPAEMRSPWWGELETTY